MSHRIPVIPTTLLLIILLNTFLFAGLPLETETARTLKAGKFEFSSSFEYQMSSEGKEQALPMAFEYGVTDKLEIMVEPVFYTAILPDSGSNSIGIGDLEVTLNYKFFSEKDLLPAFAIAGEVKIPTAKNRQIGTGEADYAGYFIMSKKIHDLDIHLNMGYTVVGQPTGVTLDNLYSFALAAEYYFSEGLQIVAETYGNTSSFSEGGSEAVITGAENKVIPEASGGELVGALGLRYFWHPKIGVALGLSYDNNNAIMFAPGLLIHF